MSIHYRLFLFIYVFGHSTVAIVTLVRSVKYFKELLNTASVVEGDGGVAADFWMKTHAFVCLLSLHCSLKSGQLSIVACTNYTIGSWVKSMSEDFRPHLSLLIFNAMSNSKA